MVPKDQRYLFSLRDRRWSLSIPTNSNFREIISFDFFLVKIDIILLRGVIVCLEKKKEKART